MLIKMIADDVSIFLRNIKELAIKAPEKSERVRIKSHITQKRHWKCHSYHLSCSRAVQIDLALWLRPWPAMLRVITALIWAAISHAFDRPLIRNICPVSRADTQQLWIASFFSLLQQTSFFPNDKEQSSVMCSLTSASKGQQVITVTRQTVWSNITHSTVTLNLAEISH